jgi:outer membrane protein TolC
MHNRIKGQKIRIIVILFVLLESGFSVFSQEKTLSFEEAVRDLVNNSSYQSAQLSYEKSRQEMALSRHPGDAELSLQPGVKTQYSESGEPGQTELTMNSGLTFVLGRSLIQENKLRSAERDYKTEQLNLETVRMEEVLALYRLYSDLWLLQQEGPILEDEKKLARERYEGMLLLYENGTATLSDLEDSEEELQQAENSLNDNSLKQRLKWFTLEQARGLMGSDFVNEIPRLEDLNFSPDLNEKPISMTEQVLNSSVEYSDQRNSIMTLSETADRLDRKDWNLLIKPTLTYGDHDWSATYNWENRNLDLDYSAPLATFNSQSAQTSQDNWVTGLFLTLSLGTGKTNRLNREVTQTEILRQQELLKEQTDKLTLELRTLYQQFIQAEQTLLQAKESLLRQSRLKAAVDTRFEAGQALKIDKLSAEISERRSRWKEEEARVEWQQAYMSLMVLAGDLSFLGF